MSILNWFASIEGFLHGIFVATLLATSLQIAMRAGVFSLATFAFYGLGAYGSGYVLLNSDLPFLFVVVLVLLVLLILAAGFAALLSRLRGLYLAMATIALVLLVQTAAVGLTDITNGALGMYGVKRTITLPIEVVIVAFVLALAALTQRGVGGRRVLAMRKDHALAAALGINVRWRQGAAFVISCGLGALAGIVQINALTVFTPDDMGFGLIISILTVLVLGGTWHWFGPFIGAIVVISMPSWLGPLGNWKEVLQGGLIVLVLIYMPGGLTDLLMKAVRTIRRQKKKASEVGVQDTAARAREIREDAR